MIFVFRKEHEIGERIRLKSEKIEKIFAGPVSQDQIAVSAFLHTI